MTAAPSDTAHGRASEAAYVFLLFVAGDEINSRQAKQNLAALCEGDFAGKCRVEIVDVLKDPEAAWKHGVLLTPTLLSLAPGPHVRIIGNLSDREQVCAALGRGS